jgi:phospholipid N-methyltransferase
VVDRKRLDLDCCREFFVKPPKDVGALVPRKDEGAKAVVAAMDATASKAVAENFMLKEL